MSRIVFCACLLCTLVPSMAEEPTKEQKEHRETLKKSMPSFMNKESPLDAAAKDIPWWAIVISVAAVIGGVGYAFYTLTSTLSDEKNAVTKQAEKRAAKAAKKGKHVNEEDLEMIEKAKGGAAFWGNIKAAFSWLAEQLGGLTRDFFVIVLVAMLVIEGWRYLPRASLVECSSVLGDVDATGKCVTAPGIEEPIECAKFNSRPKRGEFPTKEQHVARLCYQAMPTGLLKPTSSYFWDTAGATWHRQAMIHSAFHRPWANEKFISIDKLGGANSVIVPKDFMTRVESFYYRHNPETLDDTAKLANLAAKYNKNPDKATKDEFEAKTFAALHTKYQTGAMGSVISPIKGSIDVSGAESSAYRYVGRQGSIYDRYYYFMTDVLPDLFYMVTTGDY